ncbi:MAG: triose-phosphate isomerase [Erysipelotrichaceae bacterium]|nr:triose-phosphate isomerase [Erysipelotrichaceae bacterium]
MADSKTIRAPFFEIGPKSYLYGQDIRDLAVYADEAAEKYDVDIIFTTPLVEIANIRRLTRRIHVFAPHMDPLYPGRGLADILPESLVAAGAEGVMLNHAEKPLSFEVLRETIRRAREVGLKTIVCADSSTEAAKIAQLSPDIIVAEPSELIGSGVTVGPEYVKAAVSAVHDVNPDILVLVAAGISSGQDVYNMMVCGSDATGTSSAVCRAADRKAMVDEMISAVRRGFNDFHQQQEEHK